MKEVPRFSFVTRVMEFKAGKKTIMVLISDGLSPVINMVRYN